MVIAREQKLLSRNRPFLISHILTDIIMGLVVGSLFFNLSKSSFQIRYGLFFLGKPCIPVLVGCVQWLCEPEPARAALVDGVVEYRCCCTKGACSECSLNVVVHGTALTQIHLDFLCSSHCIQLAEPVIVLVAGMIHVMFASLSEVPVVFNVRVAG